MHGSLETYFLNFSAVIPVYVAVVDTGVELLILGEIFP
jgi:hypothetical protein